MPAMPTETGQAAGDGRMFDMTEIQGYNTRT